MFQFRMANSEESNRELNMFQLRMANSEECNRELNMLQFRMANSEECNRELNMFQFRMDKLEIAIGLDSGNTFLNSFKVYSLGCNSHIIYYQLTKEDSRLHQISC